MLRAPAIAVLLSLFWSAAATVNRAHYCIVNGATANRTQEGRPLLVFVHLNKGGGTLIRSFFSSVSRNLGLRFSQEDLYQDLLETKKRQLKDEDLRVLEEADIVNGAWGLCELTDRPCVYLSHLRDPMEMALSHYRYFCKLGREGAHMWKSEWKSCDVDINEWFESCCNVPVGGSVSMVSYKFTRAVEMPSRSRGCLTTTLSPRLAVATHNMFSPCTRYIVSKHQTLQELSKVSRLLSQLFPDIESGLERLLQSFVGNDNSTPEMFSSDEIDDQRKKLKPRLVEDQLFYETALKHYNATWEEQPLYYC